MPPHSILVLGPQCSGKTTVAKIFRESGVNVAEEDEIFTQFNGGSYPTDVSYKEKILRPRLEDAVRRMQKSIFLTSYCPLTLVQELRLAGWKIVRLDLPRHEFDARNAARTANEGYADARPWADQIYGFHESLERSGLVDLTVSALGTPEDVAKKIFEG